MFDTSQLMAASGGGFYDHPIEQSLRFNDNDSASLSWTPASAGNRKTWTWSGWIKRGNIGTDSYIFEGYSNLNNRAFLSLDSGANNIRFRIVNSGTGYLLNTSQSFRDPSAWYHITLAVDTTQATSSDRVKLYVNGVRVTAFSTEQYPPQNLDTYVNNTNTHFFGKYGGNNYYLDGYMAEVNFIDGTALDASSFGETKSGVWKPIEYTGSYGTNGFYLDFGNSGSIGADVSGNGNNWTPNNLAATDVVLDSPTNNFATLNPLEVPTSIVPTFSEGNLVASLGNSANWRSAVATQKHSSGKWYMECYIGNATNGTIGLGYDGFLTLAQSLVGFSAGSWGYINSGSVYNNSSVSQTIGTFTTGDVVAMAVDLDNSTVKWYVNGTLSGTTNITANQEYSFGISNLVASYLWTMNFGQDSSFAGNKTAQGNTDDNGYGDFYYAPPTGYLALCTANLEVPDAMNPALDASPQDYFNTVLYTGTGSTQSITGVGFQPDFTWIKDRTTAYDHHLFDAVRGGGNSLYSNATSSENTYATDITFTTDGFDVADGGSVPQIYINRNTDAFVAWNWKANGSGVSNTDGSITSTVSANTDAGFSIVSYTGNGTADSTIGHGLTSAPEMIIVKERSEARGWAVYHETLGYTKEVYLNYTQAATTSNFWRSAPTSSTFAVSTSSYVNSNTQDYIAYCFHSVEGFSKFGSYTGNGSANGPFVYTGFRPAFVLTKRTDSSTGGNWTMLDNARDPDNVVVNRLFPDATNADSPTDVLDFCSNGFKYRQGGGTFNQSGGTYIYVAFAENPFKYANAR